MLINNMGGFSLTRLEAHRVVMDVGADKDSLPPLEAADAEIEARLEGLPSSLRSADPTSALEELAKLIDAAEGDWASALGRYARSAGIIAVLVELVGHDDAEICALTIRVLGNLCSDAVDPQSGATKEVVREHNGFSRLLPHCYNEDLVALMYALGAIQNLCTSTEYTKMLTPPLRERIREVAESSRAAFDGGMPQAGLLAHYAEGILINIALLERELTREQGTSQWLEDPFATVEALQAPCNGRGGGELQEEADRRARAKREWRRARQQRQQQPSAAPPEPPGAGAPGAALLPSRAPGRAMSPSGANGARAGPRPPRGAKWRDPESLMKQLPATEWLVAEWSPFSSRSASPCASPTSPQSVLELG